jgi:hypothetical protein
MNGHWIPVRSIKVQMNERQTITVISQQAVAMSRIGKLSMFTRDRSLHGITKDVMRLGIIGAVSEISDFPQPRHQGRARPANSVGPMAPRISCTVSGKGSDQPLSHVCSHCFTVSHGYKVRLGRVPIMMDFLRAANARSMCY